MHLRTQTKYAVYIITVLGAALLSVYLEKNISPFIPKGSYLTVLLDILLLLLVFIPVMKLVEKFVKKATTGYVDTAKTVSRSSRVGLYLAFAIALIVLFGLFAIVKYDLTPIADLKALF